MMTTVLDGCWQRWDSNPHNDVAQEERVWLKELNQMVFSGLEKKLAGRVKVYPVSTPAFLCVAAGNESHASYVTTEWVHLPAAPFDEQVEAAIDRLDALCRDSAVAFYQLLAPVGNFDYVGRPNRLHLSVRIRTLATGLSPV